MSKTTVTVERALCDFCGKEESYHKCITCGKDICSDCRKTKAVVYPHSIYCSGGYDGTYCHACDLTQADNPTTLWLAYVKIATLRGEFKRWQEDFDSRVNNAEAEVKRLVKE